MEGLRAESSSSIGSVRMWSPCEGRLKPADAAAPTALGDLPDEILQICFARLPAASLPRASAVCRRWRRLGDARLLCGMRKALGLRRACTFAFDNEYVDGEYLGLQGMAIDAESQRARAISPLCCPRRLQYGAAGADGLVCILGGRSPLMCRRAVKAWVVYSRLDVYEPLSNSWCEMRPMTAARYGFATGAFVDGVGELKIIVAGGCDAGGEAMSSAEIFDVRTNQWEVISSMRRVCGPCTGEFFEGKFYVQQANGGSSEVDIYEFSSSRWGAYDPRLSKFCPKPSLERSGTYQAVVVDV